MKKKRQVNIGAIRGVHRLLTDYPETYLEHLKEYNLGKGGITIYYLYFLPTNPEIEWGQAVEWNKENSKVL